MIDVFCTLNYKKIPHHIACLYIVKYVWNCECLLNYVLKTMPHMMDFLMVLMIYLNCNTTPPIMNLLHINWIQFPLIYWIQFSNSKVGTRTWAKNQHFYSTKIEHTLTWTTYPTHFQRNPNRCKIRFTNYDECYAN
jgi:hypothetical protein